jgi:hypothetical protein
MTAVVAIYLAIGTVLAFHTGQQSRGEPEVEPLIADLVGFFVIATCWLPIALWAWASDVR